MRAELLAAVESLLGPKTEADLKPPEKKKKPKVIGGSGFSGRDLCSVETRGCGARPSLCALYQHMRSCCLQLVTSITSPTNPP